MLNCKLILIALCILSIVNLFSARLSHYSLSDRGRNVNEITNLDNSPSLLTYQPLINLSDSKSNIRDRIDKRNKDWKIEPVSNFTSLLTGFWYFNYGKADKIDQKDGGLATLITMSDLVINNSTSYYYITGELSLKNGMFITDTSQYFIVIGAYNGTNGFTLVISPKIFKIELEIIKSMSLSNLMEMYPYVDQDMLFYFKNTTQNLTSKLLKDFESVMKHFEDSNYKVKFHGMFQGHKMKMKRNTPYIEPTPYPDKAAEKFVIPSILYWMDGFLFSFDNSSKITFDVETERRYHHYMKTGIYTLMISAAGFLGIMFLLYQINKSHTQAMRSRVSVTTIAMLGILDSYSFLLHFTLSIYILGVYSYMSYISFFSFICFSIFETKFMLRVWKANRQVTSDQLRRQASALYTKYYGVLFIGIVIVYQFSFLFKFVLMLLYSFYIPQIILNIRKNAPKALHPVYVIGTAVTRLIVPVYFYGCPHNFFNIQESYTFTLILTSWVFLQCSILVFQYYFGSRSFVPKLFLPKKYNYRRPIPDSVVESGELTCVICYERVEGDDCLVTPCDHVYHEECLMRWMEEKLECPTCRQTIPFF